MTTLGVLGAILLIAVIWGAVKVRQDEKKKLFTREPQVGDQRVVDGVQQHYVYTPEVAKQLEVVSARARKRRSDFGTKRPRKSGDTTGKTWGEEGQGPTLT